MDASFPNATSPLLDKEFLICKFDDRTFLELLIDILKNNKIDCYLPTHSKELVVVSKNEDYLRSVWNGFFIVSPYDTFALLDDKESANVNLAKIGIPVPKIINGLLNEEKYPIFMKPKSGSGSRNSHIVLSSTLHKEYLRLEPNSVFFEYIKGTEYTVDCFFDGCGSLIAFNQRVRKKCIGGAVVVTKNDYSFDIKPYLDKIAKAFVFKGCVNFQYIVKNNIPYFIDVNLRYASGGLPLSVQSGMNIFKYICDLSNGIQLIPVSISMANNGLTMFRYFSEWYSK